MPKSIGNSSEYTPTIRIGTVCCVSGPLSAWGTEAIKAIHIAVDHFNQTQSIQNKKIELILGDSASNPEQGKNACEKLISQGVIGIVGDLTSGISAQVAKSTFDKGIPMVTIGSRKDLTESGANVFRISYTDNFQGPLMAKFAYHELCLRKIALFTDRKQPYSVGLSDEFRAEFEKLGGKIVDEQFFESGQTQFSAQLINIKAKNPDGLYVAAYFPEVGPLMRQAKSIGLDTYKLGTDGWDSRQILVSGGTAVLGGYYCTHYTPTEPRKEVQDFLKTWKAKYKVLPTAITTALAYDAMCLMLDAVKRTKQLNSRALIYAIENTTKLKGVTGTFTLKNKHGNPSKNAIIMMLSPKGPVFQKSYSYDQFKGF